MKKKHIPTRTCVGCRTAKAKKDLIRIVRIPDGSVLFDPSGKISGRGAYICSSKACFTKAVQAKQLQRALNTNIAPEVLEVLEQQLDD